MSHTIPDRIVVTDRLEQMFIDPLLAGDGKRVRQALDVLVEVVA